MLVRHGSPRQRGQPRRDRPEDRDATLIERERLHDRHGQDQGDERPWQERQEALHRPHDHEGEHANGERRHMRLRQLGSKLQEPRDDAS